MSLIEQVERGKPLTLEEHDFQERKKQLIVATQKQAPPKILNGEIAQESALIQDPREGSNFSGFSVFKGPNFSSF
jgi:hypothetical protein